MSRIFNGEDIFPEKNRASLREHIIMRGAMLKLLCEMTNYAEYLARCHVRGAKDEFNIEIAGISSYYARC